MTDNPLQSGPIDLSLSERESASAFPLRPYDDGVAGFARDVWNADVTLLRSNRMTAGGISTAAARVLWDDSSPPSRPIEKVRKIPAPARVLDANGPSLEGVQKRRGGEPTPRTPWHHGRPGVLVMWSIAGIALLIVGAILSAGFVDRPAPSRTSIQDSKPPTASRPSATVTVPPPLLVANTAPSVALASPEEGAIVQGRTWVTGKVRSLPVGAHLWAAVRPAGEARYYPSGVEIRPNADGSFRSLVYVGGSDASGQEYSVLLLVADTTADKELEGYALVVSRTHVFKGVVLPAGASVVDSRRVVRR